MGNYLYGASVQGIQEFIFKTNQLQEIVGASEIVKSLEKEFETISGYQEGHSNILLNAAGNIKAIFDDKTGLEKVVLEFPKKIMQKAYGITISQAVVKIAGDKETPEEINELEKKLKTQRNRPSLPLDLTINIMELAPKTARPLYKIVNNPDKEKEELDKSSSQKRDSSKNSVNIDRLSNDKHKIAIIHTDGNGLGAIVPKLGDMLSRFSTKLNEATKEAFKKAKNNIPTTREVILGGDDLTVICNANDALEFTKNFLHHFEEETSKIEELKSVGFEKLTACAGIAYCNEKFPFHYAVDLAEALCSATKKHAKAINKDLAPSSLMFHNVQSSNFQSWEKFVTDELTITNDKETVRCDFGAYYLSQEGQPTIENLIETLKAYTQEESPISSLRRWMSELPKSSELAKNLLARINEMASKNYRWDQSLTANGLTKPSLSQETLLPQKDGMTKTPIYDILQILSATEAK